MCVCVCMCVCALDHNVAWRVVIYHFPEIYLFHVLEPNHPHEAEVSSLTCAMKVTTMPPEESTMTLVLALSVVSVGIFSIFIVALIVGVLVYCHCKRKLDNHTIRTNSESNSQPQYDAYYHQINTSDGETGSVSRKVVSESCAVACGSP